MFQAFLDYIPHYFEDGKPISIGMEGFFSYDLPDDCFSIFEKNVPDELLSKVQMCGHVRKEMYVSPQGNILPCMSMVGSPIEDQFPNMLETPLEVLLDKDSLYMDITSFTIEDYMKHNPECRECEYSNACCGGCRAIAVRDHPTDYLSVDLDVCEYYKGGWKAKKDALLKELGVIPLKK